MDFNQLCIERASVRAYRPEPISDEILLQVLEAGRMAPSACNKQPWLFIVVDDPKILQQVQQAYPREWFNTAPQVIIVCGDHSASWKRPEDGKDHCDIDVTIAVDHLTLQAADLGLGTCWICNFDPQKILALLNLPPHLEPVALLPIGFPAAPSSIDKKRKPMHEVFFKNGWSTPFTK